ncbi:MAG TPA: hypothetical protein VGN88_03810 [Phycisphaerae bacterium]|jgi:hypothetical protein
MPLNAEHVTEEQWRSTTFEGNRREQLQAWAKLSFADKMKCVDEMQRIATAFERARPLARPIVPTASAAK